VSNPVIRRFVGMLELLSRGRFVEKCDTHLEEAIRTLEALPDESGRAALTLTINIAYESGRIEIKPTIKSKLPEEKGFSGTPFWSVDGALSIQHPSQSDMFAGPRDTAKDRERDAG
jgi:hypothetical protein